MKHASGVLLTALLCTWSTAASAQTVTRSFGSVVFPGGTAATNPGISRNFASVIFPGGSPATPPVRTGPAPVVAPPVVFGRPISHPGNSFNNGNSFNRRPGNRGGRNTPATVYAYPVYVGGGYGYSDPAAEPEPPPQQPMTMMYPQRQETARPIIIQVDRESLYGPAPQRQSITPTAAEPQEPEADKPNYLIAFKDHTIYSSVAYWFDGDTLHYFTNGNTHNQASVALIDRELTERLNRELGIDFKMPAK
jgi:hypothetical protein